MQILNFPEAFPCLFWLVAIIWSLFQSYAGYYYGLFIYHSAYPVYKKNAAEVNEQEKDKPRENEPKAYEPKECVKYSAYGFIHGAFYFICTFYGFLAWFLAQRISSQICDWLNISGGTASILVALALSSVLGISGALPRILYLGKLKVP